MRFAISDDLVLVDIGNGWPWEAVDDTECHPDGAFRKHVEDMVARGVLVDDGKEVRPASPTLTNEARGRMKADHAERLARMIAGVAA